MLKLQFPRSKVWITSLLVTVSTACMAQAPVPEPVTDQETQLGLAMYNELRDKGEIIDSSPLYEKLRPVADAISRSTQSRYPHPIKFILVREPQPNAFSTPGGNIYVTDSLLHFVTNTEELAGTLCHETAHTIHRDAMKRMAEDERIRMREIGAAILLAPTIAEALAITTISDLHSLAYSRDVESSADVTGSDICAAAGYNLWGLVWLFEEFQNADPKQIPELLSEHPGNGPRIRTLKRHFRDNPTVFAKFNPDRKSAAPFSVPKHVAEQMLSEGG